MNEPTPQPQNTPALPEAVKELARMLGGTIDSHGACPDGSGFATMSMPLPKDHWLTANPDAFNVPPMPFRMGARHVISVETTLTARWWRLLGPNAMTRQEFSDKVREAAKYAIRSSTMNGRQTDFDPDAMIQNLIVGLLGYHTEDGLSSDEWANPNG